MNCRALYSLAAVNRHHIPIQFQSSLPSFQTLPAMSEPGSISLLRQPTHSFDFCFPVQYAANATSGGNRSGQSVASNSNAFITALFILMPFASLRSGHWLPSMHRQQLYSACVEVRSNPLSLPVLQWRRLPIKAPPLQSPSTI